MVLPKAGKVLCSDPIAPSRLRLPISRWRPATGFGALKDADPLKKTKTDREAAGVGIPVIVLIEDTADLMLSHARDGAFETIRA